MIAGGAPVIASCDAWTAADDGHQTSAITGPRRGRPDGRPPTCYGGSITAASPPGWPSGQGWNGRPRPAYPTSDAGSSRTLQRKEERQDVGLVLGAQVVEVGPRGRRLVAVAR